MSVIGRIRQRVLGGDAEGDLDYVCQSCGQQFELQRQVCPDCGGYCIDGVPWSGDENEAD